MTDLKAAITAARRARQKPAAAGRREKKMRQPTLGIAAPSGFLGFARAPARPATTSRKLGLAAILLAFGVAGFALAAPGPIALPLGGCHNTPGRLIFGQTFDVSMSLARNTACSVWLHPGSTAVDRLEIVTPPQHGAIDMRGRTGVIYRADRHFKGTDFFTFAVRGQSAAYKGTSVHRVHVTVR
jgi:hypothetical protein